MFTSWPNSHIYSYITYTKHSSVNLDSIMLSCRTWVDCNSSCKIYSIFVIVESCRNQPMKEAILPRDYESLREPSKPRGI